MNILTANQSKFLKAVAANQYIVDKFYLSGGTALAAYYLQHRYSEDLDFFSFDEVIHTDITVYLNKQKKNLGFEHLDQQTKLSRNLYFLYFPKEVLKTEFTYYPFEQIEEPKLKDGIRVDSIIDIAANKLFTIYLDPSSRHFIDLYFIIKEYNFNIQDLIMKAKKKFDWHVDPIQLGIQFRKVKTVQDYPRMIKEVKHEDWQNFFINEVYKLENKLLTK